MVVMDDAGHLFLLTRRDESIAIMRDFFEEPEVEMPDIKALKKAQSNALKKAHKKPVKHVKRVA